MPVTSRDNRKSGAGLADEAVTAPTLHHGGRLRAAARQYRIELSQWLDLSTGINPVGWPVPALPRETWSRLPEDDDGLEDVAQTYYRAERVLAVAGSQAAIQSLPGLWPASRVTVVCPTYSEHAAAWRAAGHRVTAVPGEQLEAELPRTDILVLVNPNNPTGECWTAEQLLDWHARLQARGGCLIVDEAFADARPEISLAPCADRPGLIVLRSLGKFFGLAGTRIGFVCARIELLTRLRTLLGPWHVSTPARWVAAAALEDRAWQEATRQRLERDSLRLQSLLTGHGLTPEGGCALFQWLRTARASDVHDTLARQGILTRLFPKEQGLRFGLPGEESQWRRLDLALTEIPDSGHAGESG